MFSAIQRRRSQKGFTLIELLIVVAIIGIIAAILIPNLIDALQKAKQKRTVGDLRSLGSCWFAWLTDANSAAAAGAGQTQYNFTSLTETMNATQLLETLFPAQDFFYCQEVPRQDGWGTDYEYRWSGNANDANVIASRSLGRDQTEGSAAGQPAPNYDVGPYGTTEYDNDIVWANGFFIAYPAGANTAGGGGP